MTTKICLVCGTERGVGDFHTDRRAGDGLTRDCKKCSTKRRRDGQNRTGNKEHERKTKKQERSARLAKGLCSKCSQPQLPGHRFCKYHWFQSRAHQCLGKSSREVVLALMKKLESQEYRCAYTGDELIVGTCSLDHIKPICRYPELRNNLDNVIWVTPNVNLAKKDLELEDFIVLCRKVIARLG